MYFVWPVTFRGAPLVKKKRAVSSESLAPNPEPTNKRKGKRPISTETAGFTLGGGAWRGRRGVSRKGGAGEDNLLPTGFGSNKT